VVERAFQVDLRGIVDLLSHHLYGSPRVYVREVLQNAVDAITARRAVEPDARSAHRRAYRLLRTMPKNVTSIGHHLAFCALTGNEPRGLELLERHLGWLDRPPSPYSAMSFAASAALLLRRVTETGHGALPVRRPAHGDRPAAGIPAEDLRAELTKQALELAARFDARNGTGYQTERIVALMAEQPVAEQLPLSVTPSRRPGPAVVPPVGADWAEHSAAELADRAELAVLRQESAEAQEALRRLDKLADDSDLVLAGRITALRARLAMQDGGQAAVEAGLRTAVEQFAAAGDERRRQTNLGRLGALLCQTGRGADGLPLLRSGNEYFATAGNPSDQVWSLLRLVDGLTVTDGPAVEIDELLDRADALAGALDDQLILGALAWARADRHTEPGGDLAAAVDATTVAVQAYRTAGATQLRSIACHRLSALRRAQGDLANALTAAQEAVTHLSPTAPSGMRAALLWALGDLLVALDRPGEAIPDLTEAVGRATEADEPQLAAECRRTLANAYRNTDQLVDAADLAEEAAAGFDRSGDVRAGDGCRYLLANIQLAANEPSQALDLFDEIVTHARERDELGGIAQILAESADLLDRLDQDARAVRRYREAGDAARKSGDPYRFAYCRYQEALSLLWCDQADDAVTVLAEAEQAVAALPDENAPAKAFHRAQFRGNAVRVLRGADRLAEAIEHARLAPVDFHAANAHNRLAGAELIFGQVLLEAGRAGEAESELRSALSRTAPDSRPYRATAAALATALDQLDRPEEAAELRAATGRRD
jgi:tetratricopeptide (TPR) repeat protein